MNFGLLSIKKKNLVPFEKELEDLGDRWTYLNVLPKSGFIQTVHHGKRNDESTLKFVEKIKNSSDGKACLFLSDGFESYEKALREVYSDKNEELSSSLKYVQIVKKRENGKLVDLETRVIFGEEEKMLHQIREEGRGKVRYFNTSFVESRNGKYRKDNKRLSRRSACHSKRREYHDAHIDFLTGIFNFCRENKALRIQVNLSAKLFEKRYRKISPAMKEGLINHIFTLEEFLMFRAS